MAEITISLTQSKLLFIVMGVLLSTGLALHQYFMFLRAYFSPSKSITLLINYFGEANIEIVLMTISAIWIILSTFYIMTFLSNLKRNDAKVCLK